MTTVYTGSADVGAQTEDLSLSLSGVSDPVVKGRDGEATVKLVNESQCSASVTMFGNGSEIESVEVRGGSESYGSDFTFTVPSDTGSSFDVTAEATRNGDTVATTTRTISTQEVSDLISITSASFDGKLVGGREAEGTVSIQNDDSKEQTVTLFVNGTEVGSGSIYSGRSSDIDITYQLPDIEGNEEQVSVDIQAKVNGSEASTTTKSLIVKNITTFVSIEGNDLPDKTKSGETISGRDAELTLKSDLKDVSVDIEYQEEVVGSTNFSFTGTNDVSVSLTMPEVEGEEQFTVDLTAMVDNKEADATSHTFTVQGPAALVDINNVNAPSEAIGGDVITITTNVSNASSDSLNVTLQYNGSDVTSKQVRGGRDADLEFTAKLPEVDSSKNVKIPVEAIVDGVLADSGSTTVNVRNITELLSIQDTTSPDELLSGETGEIGVTVLNDSDRNVPVDVKFDGDIVGSSEISSSRSSTIKFDYKAPEVESEETKTLQVEALTGGEVADTGTTNVTVISPKRFIRIKNLSVPTSIQGGKSGEATATLANDHDSSIEASIQYDGSVIDTKTVRSSVNSDFTFVFDTEEVNSSKEKDIEVLAIVNDKVADKASSSVTVKPEDDNSSGTINNHVKIDTNGGTVTIKSSYTDSVSIDGLARGVGLTLGEDVSTKRPLGVLPGSAIDSFNGSVPPESNKIVLEFSRINYLDLETSKVFVWSVDGKKEGKGNTFEKRFTVE